MSRSSRSRSATRKETSWSGGASGISHYSGVTAGYPVAFPIAAALCGFLVYRNRHNATQFAFVFTCGLLSSFLVVHTLGPLERAAAGYPEPILDHHAAIAEYRARRGL